MAAYGMIMWVTNTINFYEVFKKVEPLKKKVAEMTAKQIENEKALLDT